MSIRDWPIEQRPRERLLAGGPAALSDAELLAVLLRTGRAGKHAVELARELLAGHGGLRGLLRGQPAEGRTGAPAENAAGRPGRAAHGSGDAAGSPGGGTAARAAGNGGLGPAGRAQLQAALELARRSLRDELCSRDTLASPAAVREFLALWLRDRGHEVFAGLFLDAQNRLIAAEELFRGTLTQTAVYPREVARRALELNCAALILAHNHPSGVAEPSSADRMLTQALKAALAQLDVPVLDHLIVAGNRCFSFAEAGLM